MLHALSALFSCLRQWDVTKMKMSHDIFVRIMKRMMGLFIISFLSNKGVDFRPRKRDKSTSYGLRGVELVSTYVNLTKIKEDCRSKQFI